MDQTWKIKKTASKRFVFLKSLNFGRNDILKLQGNSVESVFFSSGNFIPRSTEFN